MNEEIEREKGYNDPQKKQLPLIKQEFRGLLMIEPETVEARNLKGRWRYRRYHDMLLTFLGDEKVTPINNTSDRGLWMSVINRKVTNCFSKRVRSPWV